MAGGPEAAIHAILTGLLNMQQLNMELADRLDAVGWPEEEEEPQEEQDQWGRTKKEAEPKTWHSPGTDRPSRGAGTAGEISPSSSVEWPETTE